MNRLKYSMMIALLVVICSCNKDTAHKAKVPDNAIYTGPLNGGTIADGTYSGLLLADEKNDAFKTGPISSNVTYAFNSSNYSTVAGPAKFAAVSQGTFALSGNKIALVNILANPDDFDWGLILTETYSYEAKADSLIMTKTVGGNTYTYKLKKQ
jgi:hypothetical protein